MVDQIDNAAEAEQPQPKKSHGGPGPGKTWRERRLDAKEKTHQTLDIVEQLEAVRELRYQQIRTLVLEHRRFDVLAKYVLGYDPQPFHLRMIHFIRDHDEGMVLAWRGAAKTSYCTITQAIGEFLCNPNIRILFASDACDQAKTFLREVKNHLERNEEFRAIFGDLVTGSGRWSENEIVVNTRTSHAKEATITCSGMDTILPGRHFDLIISDDLVTEENSQTLGQRVKTHDYYYKTLLPCLAMPHGRMYVIGTRWHDEDLYGWLLEEDYKDATLTIGVLDEDTDESVWPEVFPTARMHRIRKGNLSAFELQYMLRAGKALGGIFTPDHFDYYDGEPGDVFKWQGCDPAVSQRDEACFFAHVSIGISREPRRVYLLDFAELKLVFPDQLSFMATRFDRHPDTIRLVVESNAFQLAVSQQMKRDYPHIPVYPSFTLHDKVARANQLAALLGVKGILIRRDHHKFLRSLCALPKSGRWDLFDAFYIAVNQGLRGVRRKRRGNVGLI